MTTATTGARPCRCGLPLHYINEDTRDHMEDIVRMNGENVVVWIAGQGAFIIPRHFLALHGLKASDLTRYNFPKATR